jgi:ADP-heptose:LPS heptosyltransferase
VAERIKRDVVAAGAEAVTLAGRLDLAGTAAIIARSALFVGSDSGLAHLAVALGVPTVVLFGPSDSLKWGTENSRHAVVRHDLPCAPCFIFGYHKPCRTIACMKGISVDDVLRACEAVLG